MSKQDKGELEALPRGFRGRTFKTTRLAAKLGVNYVKKAAGLDSQAKRDKAVKTAGALVRELGALKGVVMKFGQMASYLPGAMPPEAQRVLSKLQAESTAMTWEVIEEVLRAELGAPPSEAFEGFEEEAFAAASIGQVHRARFEGRDVAVKIQYPGVDTLMEGDLKTIRRLARIGTFGMAMDGKALVEELRDRVAEECDYELEARNQRLFKELLEGRLGEACHVPDVVEEVSARRVLTTAFVEDAWSFQRFCDEAPEEARSRAAATIFEACFDTLFRRCIYNGDPHPGNYLISPEGRVNFLDFGCVRRFEPEMIAAWKRVAKTVLDGDKAGFREHYVELGFVPKPKKFDWDHQWALMQHLYVPFTQREPGFFAYSQDYVRETYDTMIFKNPNRNRTAMPPQWLLLNRLQWGLNSVLALLNVAAPWPDIFREAVEAPIQPG